MTERKYSDGRTRPLILALCAAAVLLCAALLLGYLYFTDAFKPAPVVESKALNCYDETLRVVTDIDYEPFSYVDENGEYTGLDVELINELANRLGMNLDLTLTDWPEARRMLLAGEADVIMNMETDLITDDSGMIATLPTAEKQYVVYGPQKIHSVAELYGARVASLHQLPQIELGQGITYIDSYEEIFRALKNGEYDYAVCPVQVGNSFLEKLDIHGVYPSYAVGHVYGALALTPENAPLRDRINPILKDLQTEGFMDRLDRKWVNHRYENASAAAIIQNHPGLALILLALVILLTLMFILYAAAQRRSAAAREAYSQRLQENLEIIRAARVKAYMDELTGVRNKNAYREMEEEMQLSIDDGSAEPFAIAVCDINGLKEVNDSQGHQAGDAYIRDACHLICHIYDHSPVFRIGGDEFVVVLRGRDYEDRAALMEELKRTVLVNQDSGGVIVAVGMSDHAPGDTVASVFQRADKRMYENKITLKGARI